VDNKANLNIVSYFVFLGAGRWNWGNKTEVNSSWKTDPGIRWGERSLDRIDTDPPWNLLQHHWWRSSIIKCSCISRTFYSVVQRSKFCRDIFDDKL